MTDLLDTGPLPAPAAAAPVAPQGSARVTLSARGAWRRARLPVALGLVFLALAIAQALSQPSYTDGELDPAAVSHQGARALATLLRDHGVDVRTVEEPSGSPGTTVFIPVPRRLEVLRPSAFAAARTAGDLVVADADEIALESLRVDAGVVGHPDERVVEPGCDDTDAVAAGDVLIGKTAYTAPADATACYVSGGDAAYVTFTEAGGRRVTLLGSGTFLDNEHLDDHGDAALALRLLTRNPTLEWVYPTEPGPGAFGEDGGERSLTDLLPHRLFVFVAELWVVLLLLALWRSRRLGPVVVEPLPVVVRAAEAVEGRARLYESAAARDQAANALRAGLRDRLVRALGLAPDAPRDTLVSAVTARTRRGALEVDGLLYGLPPADDAALVRLADDLDRLDTEVRAL